MKNSRTLTESLINWFVYAVMIITVLLTLVALFSRENRGEAYIGSFESSGLSTGWTLKRSGKEDVIIDLPANIDTDPGETVTLKNTLPAYISNGTSLLTRSVIQDMHIYIGGELRETYSSDNIPYMNYYIPSAYVVTTLTEADSGKEVAIQLKVKSLGLLNDVRISHGNNAWFMILYDNLPVNIGALLVLVLGVILFIFTIIQGILSKSPLTAFYLSLLMIDMGIWMFSESRLRQLIFSVPSLSRLFSYSSLQLIGLLGCLYFDEVQHKKYHKGFLLIEILSVFQILLTFSLHFAGIVELYSTIIIPHMIMALALIYSLVCVLRDIIDGSIKKYRSIAAGTLIFLVMSTIEIILFYIDRSHVLGIFICFGLLSLMVATLVQMLFDQVIEAKERETHQGKMIVNTIETIAGAIDAKDEYTGGHSDRVGEYASVIARGMASDYNFTEDDIRRIRYVGNMHDIGKIGVADSVLNKPGKLTRIEYSLMKKHVTMGYELMESMGDSIEGLLDGIRYHHERFDGKGYPDGLSETDIPLIARIICLADCYDAMTSNRVYRKRLTDEEVRKEFIRCSGTQFDPALTEILVRLMDNGELHPLTVRGMSASLEGEVAKSVLLEDYVMETALSGEYNINYRSHIRMICYMMKLMEKKGALYDIIFIDVSDDDDKPLNYLRKEYLNKQDIIVNYHDNVYLIVMLNKDKAELNDLISMLNALSTVSIIKQI